MLLDHTDEVWHLAFSHDGCMLASCGKDQTAILWDVERAGPGSGGGRTVTRRHVLRGHTGPVAFLCWGPDSAQIATCGAHASSGSGRWVVGAGAGASCCPGSAFWAPLHVHADHPPLRAPARPAPPRRTGQDALRLWDTASGKCVAIFRHHTDPVTCAAWFPDGSRLATGSHDKQVRRGAAGRRRGRQRLLLHGAPRHRLPSLSACSCA